MHACLLNLPTPPHVSAMMSETFPSLPPRPPSRSPPSAGLQSAGPSPAWLFSRPPPLAPPSFSLMATPMPFSNGSLDFGTGGGSTLPPTPSFGLDLSAPPLGSDGMRPMTVSGPQGAGGAQQQQQNGPASPVMGLAAAGAGGRGPTRPSGLVGPPPQGSPQQQALLQWQQQQAWQQRGGNPRN